MTRRFHLHVFALALSVLSLATLGLAAPTVIYETGFEAQNDPSGTSFALGDLNGQGGWVALNATVSNAQAEAGAQSVQMAADSSIERDLSGTGEIWIVGQYRGDGSAAATPSYPATPPAACIVHFSQNNGVQCLDGDGAGGGTFVPASSGQPVSSGSWTEVALHIVYNTSTWDCLLNGAAYQTGLGFRDPISALSGFKSLSGTESYFDSFRVIASDGDVDGDGIGDQFEIDHGTNPLDPGSTPYNLLDVNGDGALNSLDGIIQYRIGMGIIPLTTQTMHDVNCDGQSNEVDGMLIYKWAIGDPAVPVLPLCD